MITYTITVAPTVASASSSLTNSASNSENFVFSGPGIGAEDDWLVLFGEGGGASTESGSTGSQGNSTLFLTASFSGFGVGVIRSGEISDANTEPTASAYSGSTVLSWDGGITAESAATDSNGETAFTLSTESRVGTSEGISHRTANTTGQVTALTATQTITGTTISGIASTTTTQGQATTVVPAGGFEKIETYTYENTFTVYEVIDSASAVVSERTGSRNTATVVVPQNEIIYSATTTGISILEDLATSFTEETTITAANVLQNGGVINVSNQNSSYTEESTVTETVTTSTLRTDASNRETLTFYPTSQTDFPLVSETLTAARLTTSTIEFVFTIPVAKESNTEDETTAFLTTQTTTFAAAQFATVGMADLVWQESHLTTSTAYSTSPIVQTGEITLTDSQSEFVDEDVFTLEGLGNVGFTQGVSAGLEYASPIRFAAMITAPASKFAVSFYEAWAVGSSPQDARLLISANVTAALPQKVFGARTAAVLSSGEEDEVTWSPVAASGTDESFLLSAQGPAVSTSEIRSALVAAGAPPVGSWETAALPLSYFEDNGVTSARPLFLVGTHGEAYTTTARNDLVPPIA